MIAIEALVEDEKLTKLLYGLNELGAENNVLPNLAKAVSDAGIAVQQRWRDNASGAFHRPTGTYMKGIQEGFQYPYKNDPYSSAVINLTAHARFIEEGTQSHDLKKALQTSPKVKVSKDGKRYLIIPFRHGTPRISPGEAGRGGHRATIPSMPESIYERAKELAITKVAGPKGEGRRLTGVGEIGRRSQIMVRSSEDKTKWIIRKKPYTWKASPYEGMIRVPREVPMASGSMYLTFRAMHEDSEGWIHPGTPPMKLAEKTSNEMRPVVTAIIQNGFESDLQALGLR